MALPRSLVGGVALLLLLSSCTELDFTGDAAEETAPPTTTEGTAGPDAVTWAPIEETGNSAARTLLPLQMYYIERYLAGVPDKTATDLAIAAILDGSPATRDFLVGGLESYRAMPESEKEERFDPDVLGMLASHTETVDMSVLLGVIDPISVIQGLVALPAPLPPIDLVAVNTSRPGSLEQDPTGGQGQYGPDPVYSVALSWIDAAFDEAGFRIYRWPYPTPAGVAPEIVATVGADARTYEDVLAEPGSLDAEVCYQVTAYRDLPSFAESDPTDAVCIAYHWTRVDPGIDTGDDDNDGFINEYDDCPSLPSDGTGTTRGCPDADRDGWPDDGTDRCESEWGEPFVPGEAAHAALPGCPQRFGVNWMGMEAIHNSISYTHNVNNISTPDGKYAGLSMNEVDDAEGEEPYLIFHWINGWSETGDHQTGEAMWCCGEGVDVAAGDVREPDGATPAEGDQALDREVREHGLAVFPPGDISRTPGLEITGILMEMDWTAKVRAASADTALDVLETAAEAALVVGGCIASAGIGCLIDIGEAIVEGFLSIFGVSSNLIEVEDPDDVMGDAVWAVTHQEALFLTGDDGAYGFSFEVPTPNYAACIPPVVPCTADIAIPSRLTVEIEMCLYRDGIPAAELRDLCEPYEPVRPWPMRPLTP
jgi:hypothetical protein